MKKKDFYIITIDPLHIGSGGINLGKVDNPITLDPATRIPKIPGTGISGATKYFTDLALIELEKEDENFNIGRRKRNNKDSATTWCASTKGECGEDCLICYTFGFSNKSGKNSKGILSFCDAHLVLFPIYSSMFGQIWITSDSIYNKYFATNKICLDDFKAKAVNSKPETPIKGKIEIGGIIFDIDGLVQNDFSLIFNEMQYSATNSKVMIIADNTFCNIVKRNLEHRTSIAIDPETGATKEGALFTFEAVPANAVFKFQVNMNDFKSSNSPFKNPSLSIKEINTLLGITGDLSALDLIKLGFKGIKEFGMGGMNTRGFGRLNIF